LNLAMFGAINTIYMHQLGCLGACRILFLVRLLLRVLAEFSS
jgi:hypothetical protein